MSQQFNNNASAVSGNTSEDENVCGIAENYIIEIRQMVCAVIIYTKKQLLPRIVFVFCTVFDSTFRCGRAVRVC